jgi:hypothetical protein
MKIKSLEIKLLKGLGELGFGAAFDEALILSGDPDTTNVIRDPDEFISTVVWEYEKEGISLFFEGEPKEALACCEIENPAATLFGKKVFKLNEREIRDLMDANGYSETDEDIETWGEKRLSYDDALIDFYFVENKLATISFGIFINSQGDVEWPVKVYAE